MKRALRFIPAVAWAAMIFGLSSQPSLPEVPFAFDGADKLLHAATWSVLAALLLYGDPAPQRAWLWGAAASLYGVADELHQMMVPGRSVDFFDWLADTGGACLAVALWLKLWHVRLPVKGFSVIITYEGVTPTLGEGVFVAANATVLGRVTLGDQASVWYGCVVRGDVGRIVIGARTNIQDLSCIHVTTDQFDTHIGSDVVVGHHVMLHGCTIGDHVLVGMGAIVMDGVEVGDGALIGAGALVTPGTRIPPGMMALGSPARVVRALTEEERQRVVWNAAHYVDLAAKHAQL